MSNEKDKILKDWLKFLNPDSVKFQLICASLYLTAYELLIDSVVKKTQEFYLTGFQNGEFTYSEDYTKEVKKLFPKDIVIASSMWLCNSGAITDEDVNKIKEFKNHRNELAHEMPKIISDSNHDVKIEDFKEIENLYKKIHSWWLLEVEIPTNSDFDNIDLENLDLDEALSLVMLPINYIVNIVNDEISKQKPKTKD